jgi:hypothetical protein
MRRLFVFVAKIFDSACQFIRHHLRDRQNRLDRLTTLALSALATCDFWRMRPFFSRPTGVLGTPSPGDTEPNYRLGLAKRRMDGAVGNRLANQLQLGKRRHRAWLGNMKTGLAVAFTMFECGQDVKPDTIRPASLIRKVGLEPTPPWTGF